MRKIFLSKISIMLKYVMQSRIYSFPLRKILKVENQWIEWNWQRNDQIFAHLIWKTSITLGHWRKPSCVQSGGIECHDNQAGMILTWFVTQRKRDTKRFSHVKKFDDEFQTSPGVSRTTFQFIFDSRTWIEADSGPTNGFVKSVIILSMCIARNQVTSAVTTI